MSENMGFSARSKTSSIVQDVLEQGQRLRNAMVKSILDNDPLYVDVTTKNLFNNLPTHRTKHLEPYLNKPQVAAGSYKRSNVNLDWEVSSSLESPPTISGEVSELFCNCEICNAYGSHTLWASKNLPFKYSIKEPSRSFSRIYPCDRKLSRDTHHTAINKIRENAILNNKTLLTDTQTQADNFPEEITKSIQEQYRSKASEYYKYVNSLKIIIHSLALNQAGNRKVQVSSVHPKFKLPASINHSYFVEFSIPEGLINTTHLKTQSKIDSGLSKNLFRICSKKLQHEEVYFKHTSIHDIVNLLQLNLSEVEIRFQVSCRTMKQKRSNIIGCAVFRMDSFEITKNLTCNQEFPILEDDFVLGTLKITLQLGCGRMYFGKEFVEFVNNNMKNLTSVQASARSEIPSKEPNTGEKTDSVIFVGNKVSSTQIDNDKYADQIPNRGFEQNMQSSRRTNVNKQEEYKSNGYNFQHKDNKEATINTTSRYSSLCKCDCSNKQQSTIAVPVKDKDDKNEIICKCSTLNTNFTVINGINNQENTKFIQYSQNDIENKFLLYGLIYVSEARYFEDPITSYFSCQGFCQGISLCSRVVYNAKDPIFNFYQKQPFLLDELFLLYMKNNSVVFNFWEKYEKEEIVIGKCQLPLHQFFVAYRNKTIADTLLQNRLPVTISDWWEPICSSVNGKINGQVKVLVAIGTPAQIHNLEVERGLKDDASSVTYIPIAPEVKQIEAKDLKHNEDASASTEKCEKPTNNGLIKTHKSEEPVKIDVGVQFEEEMDVKKSNEQEAESTRNKTLESLITQLIEQKQRNIYVESGTNTENLNIDFQNHTTSKESKSEKSEYAVTNDLSKLNENKDTTELPLRKTADLLDYLNQALTLDHKQTQNPEDDENNFKARVVIEGALHLPCKKKCKPRKTKKKGLIYEETPPSTYVTFETIPGKDLEITSVVPKCTNPQWDYTADVLLPREILSNNQKRLIFKVWHKNNGNGSQPNMQTDTVLGFAALDLSVLLSGLPSLQGWFNIVDFSCKCNGQIKIHITPLENISRFNATKMLLSKEGPKPLLKDYSFPKETSLYEYKEEPSELLNRALKRKFTELDEITQRLKLRLASVTKDDSDTSNDDFADEFEKDISTLHVKDDEEDFNMIDLVRDEMASKSLLDLPNDVLLKKFRIEEPTALLPRLVPADSAYSSTHICEKAENRNWPCDENNFNLLSSNDTSESTSQVFQGDQDQSDKNLIAGKQRIDNLLESLIQLSTREPAENLFCNRYVSGCSVNQETKSESNLNLDEILNPSLFNQLCNVKTGNETHRTESDDDLDSSSSAQVDYDCSSTSLLTEFSTCRQAPDGAGHSTDVIIGSKRSN